MPTPPLVATPAAPGRHNADPFSHAGQTITLRSSADLVSFVNQGAQVRDGRGPFSITKARLTTDGATREVYVVAINGTHFGWAREAGQPTGLLTDLKSGLGVENRYLQAVRSQILVTVPPGAKLVVAGHSLGGMIAQQVAADPSIKGAYDVRNTVTFGSPAIGWNRQEGAVHRLTDAVDPVARLSVEAQNPFLAGRNETLRFSGAINPIEAHTSSYFQDGVWRGINVLGETVSREGTASIAFRREDVQFFRAPVGTRNPVLADTGEAGGAVRVASPLTAPALPGDAVRQAVVSILRSNEGLPAPTSLDATYRVQQDVRVATLLSDRGLPADAGTVSALMDLASVRQAVLPGSLPDIAGTHDATAVRNSPVRSSVSHTV